jgi:hypothetical protein
VFFSAEFFRLRHGVNAACALVLGRLAEPMSEHVFYNFLPFSSFPDILGDDVCSGGVQRYYRVGDRLFSNRDRIEGALRDRLGRHFGLERTIFLYDLTIQLFINCFMQSFHSVFYFMRNSSFAKGKCPT